MNVLNLTSEQRMAMIQSGYNPLDSEDVKRYKARQAPLGEIQEKVARVKRENLGNRQQSDRRDYSMINKQYQEGLPLENQQFQDPRRQLQSVMEDYDYGGAVDIRERLNSVAPHQRSTPEIQSSYGQDLWEDGQFGPVPEQRVKRSAKQFLVVEAKSAVNYGYTSAREYLEAFTKLMRAPSKHKGKARQVFVDAVIRMSRMEEQIHPEVLKYYRGGIAKAEKQMYEQLNKAMLNE